MILLTFITIIYRLNNRVQVLLTSAAAITGKWGHVLRLEEILKDRDKEFAPAGGRLFTGLKEGFPPHPELLLRGGRYAAFWQMQACPIFHQEQQGVLS